MKKAILWTVGIILGIVVLIVIVVLVSFKTGMLVYEPHQVQTQKSYTATAPTAPTAPVYFEVREPDASGTFIATGLDSRYLAGASFGSDQVTGQPYIMLQLNNQGRTLLENITAQNIGKPMGLFVNGKMLESAVVMQTLTSGSLTLSPNSSVAAVQGLVQDLNAGKGLTQTPQ